jgi:hypothetical protein
MGILRGFEKKIIKFRTKEEDYVAQNKVLNICWISIEKKTTKIFRDVDYGCCKLYATFSLLVKLRK